MTREYDNVSVLLRRCFDRPAKPRGRLTICVGTEAEGILGLPKFSDGWLDEALLFAHQ